MLIETIQYRGHDINICSDEDAESPREWDNASVLALTNLKNYNLNESPYDHEEIEEFVKSDEVLAYIPVAAHIHGGITVFEGYKGSCPWDSGHAGYMYITHEKAKEEGIRDKEHALALMRGELKTLDDYLTGSVYGFNIEGKYCEDSCWGFYGSNYESSGLLEHAEDYIDSSIAQATKKRFDKLKILIKNNVPLYHRELIMQGM